MLDLKSYKYYFLFNINKNYLYNKSIIIAFLGLFLWANKSCASDELTPIKINTENQDDCLQANCLTLNSENKHPSQHQIKLPKDATLNVDKTISYSSNISLYQGIDPFDPFPSKKNFSLYLSNQTLPTMTLSSVIEHGSKRENGQSMLNQIYAWRAGPSLYWELTDNTILSSSIRWGNYSDGNKDLQTYSRIEQKFVFFSLAADLSTASYKEDLEISSGYFSPSNYHLYSLEAAWKHKFSEASNCTLAIRAGEQKLSGDLSKVLSVGSFCDIAISSQANLNFSYSLANVNGTESANYHNFFGRIKFVF